MTKLSTRKKLQKFHKTVQELMTTNLMKKGLNPSMKLSVKGQDMWFETEWPEEDDLRSFLLTFRLFVAKKEDVFLNHIFNLCHQKLKDNKLRKYLAGARKIWKKANESIGFDIVHQGKKQTPERITKLWLDGKYFHKDEDKRSKLSVLSYPMTQFYKHQLLSYLAEVTRIIFYIDRVIEKVLNEGLYSD
jgi:hypothetical protein